MLGIVAVSPTGFTGLVALALVFVLSHYKYYCRAVRYLTTSNQAAQKCQSS